MIQALRDKTMSEWATEDPKRYRELEQMLSATANPSPPKTGKQKEVEQVPDVAIDPTLPESSKKHRGDRVRQLLRKIPHPHLHR